MKGKMITDKTKKLQSLLNAQVGKGSLHNIVAAVQSYDQSLDFVSAAGVAAPLSGAPMTAKTPSFIVGVTNRNAGKDHDSNLHYPLLGEIIQAIAENVD